MDNREELKQQILEELKKEYRLIPLRDRLTVSDIFEKYMDEIHEKIDRENTYTTRVSIENAIRKVICIKFGRNDLKSIPSDKFDAFRKETERFIKEYLLPKK